MELIESIQAENLSLSMIIKDQQSEIDKLKSENDAAQQIVNSQQTEIQHLKEFNENLLVLEKYKNFQIEKLKADAEHNEKEYTTYCAALYKNSAEIAESKEAIKKKDEEIRAVMYNLKELQDTNIKLMNSNVESSRELKRAHVKGI